jgi:tRNA-uridine 2-sulfurtransferase
LGGWRPNLLDSRTIAVAVSGGVDSSAAAYLLTRGGGRLFGVSHVIWPDDENRNARALSRAAEVCGRLGIPYAALDLRQEFKACVIDDFVHTYFAGKTPNPCVRCNERIRFSRFYSILKKSFEEDGNLHAGEPLYFATGHYVRIKRIGEQWYLQKALDTDKDQSYMLYKIPKEILPFLIFPLGDLKKEEVVKIAGENGLPSASVRESQDVCFVEGTYNEYLREVIASGEWDPGRGDGEGEIVDSAGNVLGMHGGYIHYTVGQRKGLGLSSGPWYVLTLDPERNRVVVGRREELSTKGFWVAELNWFGGRLEGEIRCSVKVRYNSVEVPCMVRPPAATGTEKEPREVLVELEDAAAVTPGQSAVFYADDIVLGGGIIGELLQDG